MLGRYQPWHAGHRELFKRAYAKTGQVAIMVRDVDEAFNYSAVELRIIDDLTSCGYENNVDFVVIKVPNIVNITYGRDVGYAIEKEYLGEEIESISATKIRKEMGL